jgi:hypothetical protein
VAVHQIPIDADKTRQILDNSEHAGIIATHRAKIERVVVRLQKQIVCIQVRTQTELESLGANRLALYHEKEEIKQVLSSSLGITRIVAGHGVWEAITTTGSSAIVQAQ